MGEEFEISKIEWVWTAEDLPKEWEEKDLVQGNDWEIHSLNEGLHAAPYSDFIMNFKNSNDTSFNPSSNFLLFHCVKKQENEPGEVVVLVQDNKKYSIDIVEMEKRFEENIDKKTN